MKTKKVTTKKQTGLYSELENMLRDENVVLNPEFGANPTISFLEKEEQAKQEQFKKTLEVIKSQNKRLLDFTRIASHNLRSHASNLEGILNILIEAKTEKERNEMIGYLKNISAGLNETLTNIDEIASIQWTTGVSIEKLNLLEVIERCKSVLCYDIVKSKAVINIDVDGEIYLLHNPAYLESIVLNLMSNAIKYRHAKRKPIINIKAIVKGEELILEVQDNGQGINMNKHGKDIFGLYKTFHGNSDAKGYGLYITKSQVEAIGGKISVTSKENFGSTFNINFNYESSISN